MHARRFKIVLTPDENGTFSVSVPGLPECLTWGRTEAEAVKNAREAIACCLEAREKLSQPRPRFSRRAPKILTVEIPA